MTSNNMRAMQQNKIASFPVDLTSPEWESRAPNIISMQVRTNASLQCSRNTRHQISRTTQRTGFTAPRYHMKSYEVKVQPDR